jgi:hypothetical protein
MISLSEINSNTLNDLSYRKNNNSILSNINLVDMIDTEALSENSYFLVKPLLVTYHPYS